MALWRTPVIKIALRQRKEKKEKKEREKDKSSVMSKNFQELEKEKKIWINAIA